MIEAQSLTRRFGSFTAVSQVSFSVPDGAVLALLGPNGAGKTTTVRMLSGLLAPSEGNAIVGGYDIRREPAAVRACVGLVTDVPGLFEQMELYPYLDFFASIYGLPSLERNKRISELVEFFDLSAHRKEKLAGFSKGMKQKVALARALVHGPSVLFLDEPTSGLDPLATRSVRELIIGLKHTSRSIILCTHDLDEAERLADEVAIMRQGHIVAIDTPGALRAQATGETLVRIEFAAACPLSIETIQAMQGINSPHYITRNNKNVTLAQQATEGFAQTEITDQLLEYRTEEPKKVNPFMIAQLVEVGAKIVSVTCETRTLEDVYASAMNVDKEEKIKANK